MFDGITHISNRFLLRKIHRDNQLSSITGDLSWLSQFSLLLSPSHWFCPPLLFREPCLKPSSYMAAPVTVPLTLPLGFPIWVAAKHKGRGWLKNLFVDDQGFPDQSDKYNMLLHNINGGPILQKLKHPSPPLDIPDLQFHFPFDKALHGGHLQEQLDLSHLDSSIQLTVTNLMKKYWSMFNKRGVWVSVRNYKCVIDTGYAHPIAVKKIQYGPKELPIMWKAIAALKKVGHIRQIYDGHWLFKAVLAPKPHQEHVHDISNFVWRFCVNYVPLNLVTRIIAYPIPRCDSAVFNKFGNGRWLWLFDAPSGYHQLAVAESSQEKLAFQGPNAIKWTYMVMPFGPTNEPATFISFIQDVHSQWKALAILCQILIGKQTNTCIIVDNIVNHGLNLSTSLGYMECQLSVCLAYHLLLSLKKSFIFPK
jgi:hypothetical protein